MTAYQRLERNPLIMPLATLLLTILIQLIGAAYVYGQLSTTVRLDSEEIRLLKTYKLDKDTYYREHPSRMEAGR